MKHILISIISLVLVGVSFGIYVPVSQDADLLADLETRIDAMYMEDKNATIMIGNKIVDLLPRLSQHSRAYYILDKLYDYIAIKVSTDSIASATIVAENIAPGIPMENEESMSDPEMEEGVLTGSDNMDDTPDVEIDIIGSGLSFSESEINVTIGDVIKINFQSDLGYHDWVVDEFSAATSKVTPEDGMTNVTFVADQAGTFEYYCSVGTHREAGMVGNLIVQ